MATDNRLAKDRIINALGDLYRVQRHTNMTKIQERNVEESIEALEAEYLALLAVEYPNANYNIIEGLFRNSKTKLEVVKADREQLANAFVSATKLFGSVTQVLKLLN